MENLLSRKESDDSAEAIQALEAGIRILARMIVKAIMAELREQVTVPELLFESKKLIPVLQQVPAEGKTSNIHVWQRILD